MEQFVGKYCLVRANEAGVHAGTVERIDGSTVVLAGSRRLWRWWAARSVSLSAVALHGLATRSEVKIAGQIPHHAVRDWCEIIPCSDAAQTSIADYPEAVAS